MTDDQKFARIVRRVRNLQLMLRPELRWDINVLAKNTDIPEDRIRAALTVLSRSASEGDDVRA